MSLELFASAAAEERAPASLARRAAALAGRAAAVSPGCADSLAAFVGSYATHVLPTEPGAPAAAGSVVSIAVSSQGRPIVTVGAASVSAWSFDANNVLSWEGEAGCSAWLQFMALPGEW